MADLTTFHADVARYVHVRDEMATLEAERKALAERLHEYLRENGAVSIAAEVTGKRLTVFRTNRVTVRYDAALLRQRLGARFARVLALNVRLLRAREAEVREWLGTRFEEVAQVDRKLVQELLESGEATRDEFVGAFERRVTHSVAVVARGASLAEEQGANP